MCRNAVECTSPGCSGVSSEIRMRRLLAYLLRPLGTTGCLQPIVPPALADPPYLRAARSRRKLAHLDVSPGGQGFRCDQWKVNSEKSRTRDAERRINRSSATASVPQVRRFSFPSPNQLPWKCGSACLRRYGRSLPPAQSPRFGSRIAPFPGPSDWWR
jgi:hypothetical protein